MEHKISIKILTSTTSQLAIYGMIVTLLLTSGYRTSIDIVLHYFQSIQQIGKCYCKFSSHIMYNTV